MPEPLLSTGVKLLDDALGGFHTGDNVILEVDVGAPPHSFLHAFMRAALGRGDRVVYVSFDRSPATIVESLTGLPKGELIVLDAFTEGKGRGERVFRAFYERKEPAEREVVRVEYPQRPSAFHEDLDAAMGSGRGSFLVVESLTGMTELWGSADRARALYTHSCPRLYDTRAIAVWTATRGVHSPEFLATIGGVAQVVIRLHEDGPSVEVVKAASRAVDPARRRVPYVDDGATIATRDGGRPGAPGGPT